MEEQERKQLRGEYFKLMGQMGYKVVYDLHAKQNSDMFDLEVLCTMTTPEGKTLYGFYQIGNHNELAVHKFKTYRDANRLDEFRHGIQIWIEKMLFTVNEIIVALLYEGYDIEEIYVDNKIHLTPKTIKILMDTFNRRQHDFIKER